MKKLKVMTIAGTRPELIRLSVSFPDISLAAPTEAEVSSVALPVPAAGLIDVPKSAYNIAANIRTAIIEANPNILCHLIPELLLFISFFPYLF